MKEEIKAWLAAEERSYWTGITLYEKYGSNLSLVASLRRHHTIGNMNALVYELSKLAEVEYVPTTPLAKVAAAVVETQGAENESDLLRDLLGKRAELYKERAQVSDTLADLKDDELKAATIKVTEIDDQVIALSSQIRYVELNGKLPDAIDVKDDLDQLKSQRKTLGEKTSRQRAKVKNNPDNLDYKASLDNLEADLKKLDDRIRQLSQ